MQVLGYDGDKSTALEEYLTLIRLVFSKMKQG